MSIFDSFIALKVSLETDKKKRKEERNKKELLNYVSNKNVCVTI